MGDVTEYGEVTIDPVYGISEYPQTAEASQKAVAQIEKKLTTDPLMSMKTDCLLYTSNTEHRGLCRSE